MSENGAGSVVTHLPGECYLHQAMKGHVSDQSSQTCSYTAELLLLVPSSWIFFSRLEILRQFFYAVQKLYIYTHTHTHTKNIKVFSTWLAKVRAICNLFIPAYILEITIDTLYFKGNSFSTCLCLCQHSASDSSLCLWLSFSTLEMVN